MTKTIYLAGGMQKFGKDDFDKSNDWRVYTKKALEGYEGDYKVSVVNPNDFFSFADNPRKHDSEREVMNYDLHRVRSADLIIVNFNDPKSIGTAMEIAIAHEYGIPVIGLLEEDCELHPWLVCMTERIFDDKDKMIDYVEDFYLT